MTEHFPDIEIYIMKAEPSAVRQWLQDALQQPLHTRKEHAGSHHWQVALKGSSMDIFLNENAEKNFASLWFKQNLTPWATDLDCARAAHAALSSEVRCSDSGWQEEHDGDTSGWIKLIRGEEKPFDWI
ncbi:MAG: hypothetical protein LRY66_00675 [Saccharospirillaceae bacterium]|nr:hypothetical protein [Saccharospirillaceae bacterium]MCD8529888.1 hypothetical protein [Saccharospirillaceae bacterium]